jgi:hypothetical protein
VEPAIRRKIVAVVFEEDIDGLVRGYLYLRRGFEDSDRVGGKR